MKPLKSDKPDIPAMTDNYKRENRICAAVVLKNPAAYPKGSALEQWARLVLGDVKP